MGSVKTVSLVASWPDGTEVPGTVQITREDGTDPNQWWQLTYSYDIHEPIQFSSSNAPLEDFQKTHANLLAKWQGTYPDDVLTTEWETEVQGGVTFHSFRIWRDGRETETVQGRNIYANDFDDWYIIMIPYDHRVDGPIYNTEITTSNYTLDVRPFKIATP